jgi:hypothetical protein
MSDTVAELEQRRDALRRIIDGPSEKERAAAELADVERQMAAAAQAKADAEARLLGIKKAYPSLRREYEKDQERYRRAVCDGWDGWDGKPVSQYEAAEILNARYEQLYAYEEEARALHKSYLLELLEFADRKSPERVVPPAIALRDLGLAPLLDRPRVVVQDATVDRPRPPRDVAKERKALARFGPAIHAPGYK